MAVQGVREGGAETTTHGKSTCLTRLGVVGAGEVVRQKVLPAVQQWAAFERVLVCSLEEASPLRGIPHEYCQVGPGGVLPLDHLAALGFLSNDTLWVVATPSSAHLGATVQLAPYCRVAVEKPLAPTAREARLLQTLAGGTRQVYPIDHKLFAADVLRFLEDDAVSQRALAGATHVEGVFYERAGFTPGRQQEESIGDVLWHLWAITTAVLNRQPEPFAFGVSAVQVARYAECLGGSYTTAAPAQVWTAAEVEGELRMGGRSITYRFRQAKGAPRDEKQITLYGRAGQVVQRLDLNESGWQAHGRVLDALVQSEVELWYDLDDAVAIAGLVDRARSLAQDHAPYPLGELPGFLNTDHRLQQAS